MEINNIEYFKKLLYNDFLMSNATLEEENEESFDFKELLHKKINTKMNEKESKKNIKRYNIPNVSIQRHNHIRQ